MIRDDDCEVLDENQNSEDHLVCLGDFLKFLAESLQSPKKSTLLTLGLHKSETAEYFRHF